jgi:hypothetical protein
LAPCRGNRDAEKHQADPHNREMFVEARTGFYKPASTVRFPPKSNVGDRTEDRLIAGIPEERLSCSGFKAAQ